MPNGPRLPNQLALHHILLARLGAKGQGGIILQLGGDGVAARRPLFWLEERKIKVRMGPCGYATAQVDADVTGFNISTINGHGVPL